MKPDFYTKAVLTVIASALVVIAAEKTITNAHAQNRPTKVVICDAYVRRRTALEGRVEKP